MLARWHHNPKGPQGPMPAVTRVFETIGTAAVARSADEARDLLYLRDGDGITMNRDRLLAEAKAKALQLADNYIPPQPAEYALPGPTAATAMNLVLNDFHRAGKATDHDVTVGKALAWVLSGGKTDMTESITENHLLSLERRTIVELLKTSSTLDRIEHMLETGKPLRN
jgi:3-hydroxyacyl-CoA dehydrogenase